MRKTLVAYFSASGTTAGAAKNLVPSCPGAVIKEGRLLNGRSSVDDLRKWVDTL